MGIAQRIWEADQERGYLNSTNKTVCMECIEEVGLQTYIDDNSTSTTCSYCTNKGKDIKACDFNQLLEYIYKCIKSEWTTPLDAGLPYESAEGGWQVASVIDKHEMFSSTGLGITNRDLYNDLVSALIEEEWCKAEPYLLNNSERLLNCWESFSKFVKESVRYYHIEVSNHLPDSEHPDEMKPADILFKLGTIIIELGLFTTIQATTPIFRFRSIKKEDLPVTAKLLGPPSPTDAKLANRMSPAGISMFYGALAEETAIAETYEKYDNNDYAFYCSVYKPTRELTLIKLDSFYNIPSLFDPYNRCYRNSLRFLNDFIADFTKPICRDDRNHIEYIPTQIVTEYFRYIFRYRTSYNIDGIMYPSSKIDDGNALVLFANATQCIDKDEKLLDNTMLRLQEYSELDSNYLNQVISRNSAKKNIN